MIKVLIPLADGHCLLPKTLESLAKQSMPCAVLPLSRRMDSKDRRKSEALCRNELRCFAEDKYCVMMDSDVILESPTIIEEMVLHLDSREDLDAVAVNTKRIEADSGHVCIALVCYRSPRLREVNFKSNGICCCNSVFEKMAIEYLPGKKVCEYASHH